MDLLNDNTSTGLCVVVVLGVAAITFVLVWQLVTFLARYHDRWRC